MVCRFEATNRLRSALVVRRDLGRICRTDGSAPTPVTRSPTHSACASASGMIAPSGWISPTK